MLSIIAHQIDAADTRVARRQFPNGRPTPVPAGIIHEQNLIFAGHSLKDQIETAHQLPERGFRIIYGDYNRDGQQTLGNGSAGGMHEIT